MSLHSEEMMEEFRIEMAEIAQGLDEALLRWERDPSNPDLPERIFRQLHTLKGSSGFLELFDLSEMCHAAEDLISALRKGKPVPFPAVLEQLTAAVSDARTILDVPIRTQEHPGLRERTRGLRAVLEAEGPREPAFSRGLPGRREEPEIAQPKPVERTPVAVPPSESPDDETEAAQKVSRRVSAIAPRYGTRPMRRPVQEPSRADTNRAAANRRSMRTTSYTNVSNEVLMASSLLGNIPPPDSGSLGPWSKERLDALKQGQTPEQLKAQAPTAGENPGVGTEPAPTMPKGQADPGARAATAPAPRRTTDGTHATLEPSQAEVDPLELLLSQESLPRELNEALGLPPLPSVNPGLAATIPGQALLGGQAGAALNPHPEALGGGAAFGETVSALLAQQPLVPGTVSSGGRLPALSATDAGRSALRSTGEFRVRVTGSGLKWEQSAVESARGEGRPESRSEVRAEPGGEARESRITEQKGSEQKGTEPKGAAPTPGREPEVPASPGPASPGQPLSPRPSSRSAERTEFLSPERPPDEPKRGEEKPGEPRSERAVTKSPEGPAGRKAATASSIIADVRSLLEHEGGMPSPGGPRPEAARRSGELRLSLAPIGMGVAGAAGLHEDWDPGRTGGGGSSTGGPGHPTNKATSPLTDVPMRAFTGLGTESLEHLGTVRRDEAESVASLKGASETRSRSGADLGVQVDLSTHPSHELHELSAHSGIGNDGSHRSASGIESASLSVLDESGLFIERATTVRVDVARLDTLLNLMGDLLQEKHRQQRLVDELMAAQEHNPTVTAMAQSHRRFERLISDLQDAVLSTRMLPVQGVFRRYPRIVKDLAARLGKEVELSISGEQTELDRALLEGLFDPLIHLLRNSIDHGIEAPLERLRRNKNRRGTISLTASQEGNQIVLEIRDDGRGIDPEEMVDRAIKLRLLNPDRAKELNEQEKIDLIFLAGFTSRPEVTETSGRGVGMSVVRDHLRRIGGLITVHSRQGEGTTLRIAMPLTLAILQVLLVRVKGAQYAIPLSSVVGAHRVDREQLTLYRGGWYLPRPGSMLPLYSLSTLLGLEPPHLPPNRCYLAEVGVAEKRYGVWVDGFDGIYESVIKSLEGSLTRLPGVAGGTFIGSGDLVLVLDVGTLLEGQMARDGS